MIEKIIGGNNLRTRIINKQETVEVFFIKNAVNETMVEDIREELNHLIKKTWPRIEGWSNLIEIEIGYDPEKETGFCEWYKMDKYTILKDGEKGKKPITITKDVHRNKMVDNWLIYHKFVIKNKNPIRNINALLGIFNVKINDDNINDIKQVIKGEKTEISF